MLSSLDWNAVATAIRYTDERTPALLEFDYEAVAEAVLKAAEHWAVRDYQQYEILAVENKFEVPFDLDGIKYVISGILDVELRDWKTGAERNVDWKTRNAKEFGDGWDARYRYCWQGRIYSYVTGRRDHEWRGICRGTNTVKTVITEQLEGDRTWVANQIAGVLHQMGALAGHTVWPQKKPSACGAYGRNCDFKNTCESRLNPQQRVSVTRLSPTDMETFMLCPERYRLGEILSVKLDEDIDDRSALDFGLAFHRGIAEVYMQLQRLQQEQKAA